MNANHFKEVYPPHQLSADDGLHAALKLPLTMRVIWFLLYRHQLFCFKSTHFCTGHLNLSAAKPKTFKRAITKKTVFAVSAFSFINATVFSQEFLNTWAPISSHSFVYLFNSIPIQFLKKDGLHRIVICKFRIANLPWRLATLQQLG